MHFQNVGLIAFILLFVLIIGAFAFRIIKYGGFKAAMFGERIERTVGEVSGGGMLFVNFSVRIHVLGGDSPEKAVGLELVAKSFASYQMFPVTLSVGEATSLIALLQSALGAKQAG